LDIYRNYPYFYKIRKALLLFILKTLVENGFTYFTPILIITTNKMANNSISIVNVRNIDSNKLSFVVGASKPGRNPSVNIKYDGRNFQLKLPRMSYRLMTRDGDDGSRSYTLSASLKGCDNFGRDRAPDTDDVGRTYNFLMDLENKIMEAAIENSGKWFGKKRSDAVIRESFKKILRVSSDKVDGEYVPNGKYPPSFYIKVPVYDGKVNIGLGVVDARGNDVYVTPDNLSTVFPNNSEANLAVSASIYVMAGGGFGVTWRINGAQVFPQTRVTAAALFMDESEQPAATEETEQSVQVAEEDQPTERPSTPDQPTQPAAPTAPARKRRAAQ
jgi:hypothetical protein